MNKKIISGKINSIESFINLENSGKDIDKLDYIITLEDGTQHHIYNSLKGVKVGDYVDIACISFISDKTKKEEKISNILNKKSASQHILYQNFMHSFGVFSFILNMFVLYQCRNLGIISLIFVLFIVMFSTYIFFKQVAKNDFNSADKKILKKYKKGISNVYRINFKNKNKPLNFLAENNVLSFKNKNATKINV